MTLTQEQRDAVGTILDEKMKPITESIEKLTSSIGAAPNAETLKETVGSLIDEKLGSVKDELKGEIDSAVKAAGGKPPKKESGAKEGSHDDDTPEWAKEALDKIREQGEYIESIRQREQTAEQSAKARELVIDTLTKNKRGGLLKEKYERVINRIIDSNPTDEEGVLKALAAEEEYLKQFEIPVETIGADVEGEGGGSTDDDPEAQQSKKQERITELGKRPGL